MDFFFIILSFYLTCLKSAEKKKMKRITQKVATGKRKEQTLITAKCKEDWVIYSCKLQSLAPRWIQSFRSVSIGRP
jgi:hypothetical protein